MPAIKQAKDIVVGDHVRDKRGKQFEVTEVRRDPFAPTARWIVIRLSDVAHRWNEGEICCTSGETFEMVEQDAQRERDSAKHQEKVAAQ
jgi:hypothetical protein